MMRHLIVISESPAVLLAIIGVSDILMLVAIVVASVLGLLIVRAGRDAFAGLNASLDRFVIQALLANRDIELHKYPPGVHAFDILDASAESQRQVQAIVRFFSERLGQGYSAL